MKGLKGHLNSSFFSKSDLLFFCFTIEVRFFRASSFVFPKIGVCFLEIKIISGIAEIGVYQYTPTARDTTGRQQLVSVQPLEN